MHRCSERLTPPLSEGHPPAPGPRAVLGLSPDATRAEAQRAFRRLAKQTHPDLGGDAGAFRTVAGAWADLAAALPREAIRPPAAPAGPARLYRAVAAATAPGHRPVASRIVWSEPRPPVRRAGRPDFAHLLAAEMARQAA
jgi:molecular chaperone DnaJ